MTRMTRTVTQEENMHSTVPQKVTTTTTQTTPSQITDEPPQQVYQKKKAIFRSYQVVWYILGVVEILLLFRLFLRFIGANPQSGFAQFIYTLTAPLVAPFQGVVKASTAGGAVLEWQTIIAMVVYWVLTWGVIELLQLIKPVNSTEVEHTVDSY